VRAGVARPFLRVGSGDGAIPALWEPASKTIVLTLAIPRGQVAMATGQADPDSRRFTVKAARGSPTQGIITNPFLEYAFQTTCPS
jgi:hypothetical protein